MPSLLRNNRAYSRDAKASVPVRGQTTHGCRAPRAGQVSRRDVGHGCRHPPSRNAPRRSPNPAHRRPLTALRTDAAVKPERLSRPGRGGGDAWDRSTPGGLKRRREINRWRLRHRGVANGLDCRWLRSGSPRGELPPPTSIQRPARTMTSPLSRFHRPSGSPRDQAVRLFNAPRDSTAPAYRVETLALW